MKIHAVHSHPAYHPDLIAHAKILLNGAPVPGPVVYADDVAGEVMRLTGEMRGDISVTETLTGRVQICLPDHLGHLRYSFMPNPRV
jgi:hypothetical protein